MGEKIEGWDYVVCQICSKHFRQINSSHLKSHGITTNEYKQKYPDSKMKVVIRRDDNFNPPKQCFRVELESRITKIERNVEVFCINNEYNEYGDVRDFVRIRDGCRCRLCNLSIFDNNYINFYFIVHHILPKDIYPKFRKLPVNLVLLCPSCHKKIHKKIRESMSLFGMEEIRQLIIENMRNDVNDQRIDDYYIFIDMVNNYGCKI